MGLLVDGKWQDKWYSNKNGEFKREQSQFRGSLGSEQFPAESGRYTLIVSLACPWAHRTLVFRELKDLQSHIDVVVVDPRMHENGWEFSGQHPQQLVPGAKYLYELYLAANPDYQGRVTVPVLWDKKQKTIVNNESSEIIRMLNTEFNSITGNDDDYYPQALRDEINAINEVVYNDVNNGVYRAGFATTQQAYEKAFHALFSRLDELDARLATNRYLVGDQLTEADWRLFTTLIRFDSVYHGHFKCNLRRIEDYKNLAGYIRELFQVPGVAGTVNFDHIKTHYYDSHRMINPTGIVPVGPQIDYFSAHGREAITGERK